MVDNCQNFLIIGAICLTSAVVILTALSERKSGFNATGRIRQIVRNISADNSVGIN